jgi:hypothetical protein
VKYAGEGRTRQCPVRRHVILSLGLGAGWPLEALSSCGTGQSGAPLTSALTFWIALFTLQSRPLRADSRYSAGTPDSPVRHRTLSGATPDSPVNYSGGAPKKPEGEEFELVHPGAPDTVRCARPRHTSVSFLLLTFEPQLVLLIGLCWTFGTCRMYDLKQTS